MRARIEKIMLRADAISCMPDKYRKRIREIAKFAADCAMEKLREGKHVRGHQGSSTGNEPSGVSAGRAAHGGSINGGEVPARE